jgi:tetratricopeptide (TPR) repeat protein
VVAATPAPATVDVAKLVEQANALMRRGQFAEAAEAYRTAELHAQDRPDIIRLRQEAEKLQVDFDGMVSREQEVETRLADARTALRLHRYPAAIAAAELVLAQRPKDEEARTILKKAQAEVKRQSGAQIAAGGPQSTESTPSTEGTATTEPSEAEVTTPAVPRTGALQMSLRIDADAAEGAVRVLVGSREVWDQSFDVGTGILKRRRGRDFTRGVEVSAGENQVSVFYAPRNIREEADKKMLKVDVPGGTTRRMDIRVTQSKKLYVITD